MYRPLVSIIITNHNGLKFLNTCLTSVYNQSYKKLEVILVDNASADDSMEFVKKKFPRTIIIPNRTNSGYAEGNNIGLHNSHGEYVTIINNDTEMQPDTIEILLGAFSKISKLGAVSPMVKLMNRENKLDACGSFWTNTGFNYHYGIYKDAADKKYSQPFPVYSLKGVCMMMPRKIIEKIGLFDERYWCYFEETDFCHRIWLAGYECWYYPSTFMYHYLSGTRSGKNEAYIQYHSYKNRLNSYIKNLGTEEMIKVLPVYLFMTLASAFIYALKSNFSCSVSILKAIVWNIGQLHQTLSQRNHIQHHLRKLDDRQIFKKVKKNPRFEYYGYLFNGLEKYEDDNFL